MYNKEQHETSTNSIIIIGANGAGKSKLGVWIEEVTNMEELPPYNIHGEGQVIKRVHRIGAQRMLNWKQNIDTKSLQESFSSFFDQTYNIHKRVDTSIGIDDIDDVLSAVFAKRTAQLEEFDERWKNDRNLGEGGRAKNIVDNICEIFTYVFPNLDISFMDREIIVKKDGFEYNGIDMSEGERVALYLIAQALLIPSDTTNHKTILIDEPEIHLHSSIMNRLWGAIENFRNDCLFIYITHDIEFASKHRYSDKIWCKNFNGGQYWDWEKVDDSDLPDELLLSLLGNKKQVIFVEENTDSYDFRLHSAIYGDYHIVPCGNCHNVIMLTKAAQRTPQLVNYINVFGIIDRDYRSQYEIDAYAKDNIFPLKVAEVENLFICEEILNIVARQLCKGQREVDNAMKYIMDERFNADNELSMQKASATISELNYKLSTLDISNIKQHGKDGFISSLNQINYDDVYNEISQKYDIAIENRCYKHVLSLYNRKSLRCSVGSYFGLRNNEYVPLVLNLFNSDKSCEIINALSQYLPSEIPRILLN